MAKPEHLEVRIFLDSGDPAETQQALQLLDFLDGQTTNPSLVAKNPEVLAMKELGTLNADTIWQEYKKVAETIHEIIPAGSVSVEVYADDHIDYDSMLAKGRELSRWFPGVFVKLPITPNGLKVAHTLVAEGININMTLCFSQEQAAAVHMATLGAKSGQVYVSPFIGRLDDTGVRGLDLVDHIARMYKEWGSHVLVLAASIRSLDHLFGSFEARADIVTIPIKIVEAWHGYGLDNDPKGYLAQSVPLLPIPFQNIDQKSYDTYDIRHALTDAGILKFSTDWMSLLNH